ncbi:hypothetical protein EXIGLDRAFT_763670 [Exidia glandulosa HHB12029]|uniref:MYND-type domain-containing protein n=1 Tax=Exidia glandulosa HHB12029 TaxID=1314781 RepID=A0A165LV48_EXIGL|nr:hypothetical protein EXIGLDRAFT_763670 [Exidia glandulosa HHB12029]
MDTIAEHLLPALRDAHCPTFCTDCTLHPLEVLLKLHPTTHTNALILRQRHHELLTTIMNFLTTPRSDEDLNILRDSLLHASCACPLRSQHASSPVSAGDTTGDALQALAYTISAVLEAAPDMLRTQLFSRKGLWPRSPTDLLPRPPQETLTSLLAWADRAERSQRRTQTRVACNILHLLLTVCRPELLPELFVHETRLLCIDIMVRQLVAAAADIGNNAMSESPLLCIETVVDVFHIITYGLGSQTDDWAVFAWDSEPRLIRALDAAWHCVDETTHLDLKSMIMILQNYLATLTGRYELLSQPILDAFQAISSSADIYMHIYFLLKAVDGSVECNYLECRKHTRDIEGGRLRKCGSCRLTRYCSRECQKRHWVAQPLPHRLICPALTEIFQFAPLSISSAAFGVMCRTSPRPHSFFHLVYSFLCQDEALNFRITRRWLVTLSICCVFSFQCRT